MINWLFHRRLAAFEAKWHYPMDYARQLLAGSRRAFWGYARLAPLANHREGVPLAAWHVAKIVALRSEDCGPCTQLAVDMARADGVADALLQAALADDRDTLQRLDADAAVAHAFALAWAGRDADLPAQRAAAQQRFGDTGMASLALTMSVSRVFPQLKSALGHGEACGQIRIGDRLAAPVSHLALKRSGHSASAEASRTAEGIVKPRTIAG